jgi:hypothetical protein
MRMPSRSDAENWLASQGSKNPSVCLALAGGAPLDALESDNDKTVEEIETFVSQLSQGERIDPFITASHWGKADFGAAVSALQKWSYDLMMARFAGKARYYPTRLFSLQAIGKSVDLRLLLDFQRRLVVACAQAAHPLNSELQLEALLVRYAQMFQTYDRT